MHRIYTQHLRRKHSKKLWLISICVCICTAIIIYVGSVLLFSNATYSPPNIQKNIQAGAFSPVFPSYGSSGVAIANTSLAYSNNSVQQPMASTAKLVAALTLLDTLKNTDLNNEYFTITEADVALTNAYKNKDGSIAVAPLGARVSYNKALQYMLILSANNFTDILTQKVFTTPQQYLEAANLYLKKNGINDTVITDATGFNPATKSTAQDMLRIGTNAASNPIITDITRQRSVVDLNGITQKSTNLFLPNASGEIIGLKTGFTDEAKAVFLNATQLPFGATIVAVSMGADTPATSQADTAALVSTVANTIKEDQLSAAEQPIASVTLPWNVNATLYAKDAVSIQNAANQEISYTITMNSINKNTKNGDAIGILTARSILAEKSYPIYIEDYLPAPLTWRLMNPFE